MAGGGVEWRGVNDAFKIRNSLSHHEIASSKDFWWIAYLETSKVSLREILSHLTPSGLYMFIPFLRAESKESDKISEFESN